MKRIVLFLATNLATLLARLGDISFAGLAMAREMRKLPA
jgi:hypothetical protein